MFARAVRRWCCIDDLLSLTSTPLILAVDATRASHAVPSAPVSDSATALCSLVSYLSVKGEGIVNDLFSQLSLGRTTVGQHPVISLGHFEFFHLVVKFAFYLDITMKVHSGYIYNQPPSVSQNIRFFQVLVGVSLCYSR